MKTTTVLTATLTAMVLSLPAQTKNYQGNGGPKPGVFVPHTSGPDKNEGVSNNQSSSNQWFIANGGFSGTYGSYGSYNMGYGYAYNPYQGYYGNVWGLKKSARHSIRSASHIIGEAIHYHNWNELYSPLLAKAIRHHNYAKQLYWWGNFHAALNHAERASYLAWYSLQYFGSYDNECGNGNGYPDPYSDPYNPYYRKNGNNKVPSDNTNGYRKGKLPESDQLDSGLPELNVNDSELIRSFDKSEIKDE